MMDLFNDSVINPKTEVDGVWKPLNRHVDVKIARANNPEYKRLLRRKYKSVRASLEQDDDTAMDLSDELMQEVYAATIFKDLRINDETEMKIDGQPYKNGDFSYDIALKLLSNELFRNKIKGYAEDQEAFLMFGDSASGKDLPLLSDGT